MTIPQKPAGMDDPKTTHVKCAVCADIIPLDTGYQFVTCKCDKKYIAVDGGPPGAGHYTRFIGEPDQFIFLNENGDIVDA